jgi:hypothetical protein
MNQVKLVGSDWRWNSHAHTHTHTHSAQARIEQVTQFEIGFANERQGVGTAAPRARAGPDIGRHGNHAYFWYKLDTNDMHEPHIAEQNRTYRFEALPDAWQSHVAFWRAGPQHSRLRTLFSDARCSFAGDW